MTINEIIDRPSSETVETLTSESLTYDKWKKWYYETYLESDAAESFPFSEWDKWLSRNKGEDRIYRERVTRMQSSNPIRENFLSYPTDLQKRIMSQVLGDSSMRLIEECTQAFLAIQERHGDITDRWFEGSPANIRQIIRDLPEGPSREFCKETDHFVDQRYKASIKYRNSIGNWSEITAAVCELMWMLYGEDTALEVVKKFNKYNQSSDVMLMEVMRRWEELKDYPFDWVLSVIPEDVK